MNTRVATTAIPYTEMEVATGNFDTTRAPIDRVVIHTMVGTAEAAAARFDNPSSQVSAHYGVKLDGSLIHWLEEYNTAYHAGDYPMNQRSIGIEHEDNGDYNGVRPDTLYTTSAKLVADICQFYNIPIDRDHIKKHSEVSDAPTGCPDALDIDRIVREAAAINSDPLVCDPKSVRDMLVGKATIYDAFSEAGYNNVSDVTAKLQGLQATIDTLNSANKSKDSSISLLQQQVSDLQSQVLSLTQAKEAAEGIAKQVPQLQEQLNQAKNDRTVCLQAQETQNKTIGQLRLQVAQKIPDGFWNRVLFLLNK